MISVTILTKNSADRLAEVLEGVHDFDEVVIYDTGSYDDTLQIASQYSNVTIQQGILEGFGPTHNKASSVAKHDWILSIDSDEVVTSDLALEIGKLSLDPKVVYSFQRKNFYNGKWIKGCGWHPDRVCRLYHKGYTKYCDSQVHEKVLTEGMEVVEITNPIFHYPYKNTAHFLAKMQTYSDLFAKQNKGKKRANLWTAISHALFAFVKCYFFKRGVFLGAEGFIISVYNANTAFYKYLKLKDLN